MTVPQLSAELEPGIRSAIPGVTFLYVLLRDYLPAGAVENIVAECEQPELVNYANEFIAAYAIELHARIFHQKPGDEANAMAHSAIRCAYGPGDGT